MAPKGFQPCIDSGKGVCQPGRRGSKAGAPGSLEEETKSSPARHQVRNWGAATVPTRTKGGAAEAEEQQSWMSRGSQSTGFPEVMGEKGVAGNRLSPQAAKASWGGKAEDFELRKRGSSARGIAQLPVPDALPKETP